MATDFTYNNKTINVGGPVKPSGKNQPLDPRTEVKLYADIKSVPSPYIGNLNTSHVNVNHNRGIGRNIFNGI